MEPPEAKAWNLRDGSPCRNDSCGRVLGRQHALTLHSQCIAERALRVASRFSHKRLRQHQFLSIQIWHGDCQLREKIREGT